MLKRIFLSFCITIICHHLLGQCGNCDSILRAQGYNVLTQAEIAANPSLLKTVQRVECPPCDCEEQKSQPIQKGPIFKGKWGYISFRAGDNNDRLITHGSFVTGFKFDRSRKNYFSIGFDLDAPEWHGFVIRAEVAWKPQSFEGTKETAEKGLIRWQIKANTLEREVSFLYKSTKGRLRWFLGGGLGKNRLYIQKNTWTNQNTTISMGDVRIYNSNWFTSLSGGLLYLNKIELRYKRLRGSQWSYSSQRSIKNKSNIITVGYRF